MKSWWRADEELMKTDEELMKSWGRTDEELMKTWWRTDEDLMKTWWRTDQGLMKNWWRSDEELMKNWWRIDEELMKNLWRTDEELMKNWWRTDEELMMNRWWTDDELMMNSWWTDDEQLVWSGVPKTITDYHRLPLTDWFYSIEHSKLSPGIGYYIPDSTNYKSTASGANNDTKGSVWTKITIKNGSGWKKKREWEWSIVCLRVWVNLAAEPGDKVG